MSYRTHQHIVRIPKSLNQSQSFWSQFLQQLFSTFVDELESIRSQDSSFVDSACPFEDLLKTVEDAEFSEDCLEFGTLHLLALFKIEAVDSDDGVSDSCINESESCVGVPDLFLAETFFRSLCEFESHIFHWDAGKVGEYVVDKEGATETLLVDFERKVSLFEVFEIFDTRSKWLSFLESVQRLSKETSNLKHQNSEFTWILE